MDLPIDQCANGVQAPIVEAIIQAESSGNPWAVNVNVRDGQAQPLLAPARSRDEAVAQATQLRAGGYSFDVGLMQVNSANVSRLGVSIDHAFDVCTNLDMGTTVYNEFAAGAVRYADQFDTPHKQLMATLSAYNTGSYWKGFMNGYVYRVLRYMGKPVQPQNTMIAAVTAPMEVDLDFGSDLVALGDELTIGAVDPDGLGAPDNYKDVLE
jgi:type IV secretion system protein VirB1